ncbi:hypothetical protein SporoP37_06200 [Sporosarcina sp. P37]|uniref:CHY zinc finger protein n=1 Tax=unclassified Sporosarcina TaxID=2647733 RepID=UPI000A17C233|nr:MULTISPECIES: CHY zinc finger protein [unclassified Sporosarcina]ARK24297.1 hypothetical protein SporoP37_06200 [Sporosarcina sp. P37]
MKRYTPEVRGLLVDDETRCIHYAAETDRIAIKFCCCQTYYPCHLCHEEKGCGNSAVWPVNRFDEKAVLCGNCGHELTITEYFQSGYACPACEARFNPGCGLHRELYFANEAGE